MKDKVNLLNKIKAGFSAGVEIVKSGVRKVGAFAVAALAVGVGSSVVSTPVKAVLDVSDVTDALTANAGILVTAAGLAIAAALTMWGLKVGGVWVLRIFQRFIG